MRFHVLIPSSDVAAPIVHDTYPTVREAVSAASAFALDAASDGWGLRFIRVVDTDSGNVLAHFSPAAMIAATS